MPTNINGFGYVDDQGNKSISINLSNCRKMTNTEYQQLSQDERTGAIIVTDYPIPEESDEVSVTADGVKTIRQILNDLYALIDFTKLNGKSVLVRNTAYGPVVYHLSSYNPGNEARFCYTYYGGSPLGVAIGRLNLISGGSSESQTGYYNNVTTDISSVPDAGDIYTIIYDYYKNQDIHTEYLASNCMMQDGSNVESVIGGILNKLTKYVSLTSTDDLNNCTDKNTIYAITGAVAPINAPDSTAYNALIWNISIEGGAYAIQFYVSYNHNGIWFRTRELTTWKQWRIFNTTGV